MKRIIWALCLCCFVFPSLAQERYDLTAINKLLSTISPERYLDSSKDIFEFGFILIQGSNRSDSCLVNLSGKTVLDINDFNSKDPEAFDRAIVREIIKENPSFLEFTSNEDEFDYNQCIRSEFDDKGYCKKYVTNKEGKVVLSLNEADYENLDVELLHSKEPFVSVRKNEKYGLFNIDAEKYILPCEFDEISLDDIKYECRIKLGSKTFELTKPTFYYADVTKGNLKGVFNINTEKQIISCEYEKIDCISDDLSFFPDSPNYAEEIFRATKNGTSFYFNSNGLEIKKIGDLGIRSYGSHHKLLSIDGSPNAYAYYDLNGEMVIPAGNYRYYGAIGDYYFVSDNTTVCYLYKGKQISKQQLIEEKWPNSIPICPSPKISLKNTIKLSDGTRLYELVNEMGQRLFPYPSFIPNLPGCFSFFDAGRNICHVNSIGYLMLPYFKQKNEYINEDYDFMNGLRYYIIDTKTGGIGNLSEMQ